MWGWCRDGVWRRVPAIHAHTVRGLALARLLQVPGHLLVHTARRELRRQLVVVVADTANRKACISVT